MYNVHRRYLFNLTDQWTVAVAESHTQDGYNIFISHLSGDLKST